MAHSQQQKQRDAAPSVVAASAESAPSAQKATAAAPTTASNALPGFVLARWTGAGSYLGVWYTQDGAQQKGLRGPTLGFFDERSVLKLKGQFERYVAGAEGAAEPTPLSELADVKPPPGYVLMRWHGLGTFQGAYLTFPEMRERPYCKGPTLGFFAEKSVKKLKAQFSKP